MKNIIRISASILLIPLLLTLLAIWHWKPGAFVLAFVLLTGGAVLLYQLMTKKLMRNKTYGFATGLALLAAMLLVSAIAWFIGAPAFDKGVWAVFGLHAAFAVLFAGPALLFRKAARS